MDAFNEVQNERINAKELDVGGEYQLISLEPFEGNFGIAITARIVVSSKERTLVLPSLFGKQLTMDKIAEINNKTNILLQYKGPAGRTHLFSMREAS